MFDWRITSFGEWELICVDRNIGSLLGGMPEFFGTCHIFFQGLRLVGRPFLVEVVGACQGWIDVFSIPLVDLYN